MRIVIPTIVGLLALSTLALASPLRCDDPCVVDTNNGGYLPPVVEIASGGSVVWHSTGGGHIQADFGQAASCFVTFVEGGGDSEAATFTIEDGALWANTTDLGDAECGNAKALPTGDFVLPYECTIHPNMRGTIVVQQA